MIAKDPVFQQWCGFADEEDAAQFIRSCCRIESRKELASNVSARHHFERLITEYQAATGRLAEARG